MVWVGFVVVLISVGFVVAYNSDFSGGQPSMMGHSSDEIHVKNSSGDIVTLQELIDQGGLGSGNLICTEHVWSDKTRSDWDLTICEKDFHNPGIGGCEPRYMISSDSASVTQRCKEIDSENDFGFATITFDHGAWCSYSNAHTARWVHSETESPHWQAGSCEGYNVYKAKCCKF